MLTLRQYDTITVIEPHHDDFCLNMLGTMLHLQSAGTLKMLKIISVFSIGAGISRIPTSVLRPFFRDIEFEAMDLNMKMIMPGGNADERKVQSLAVPSFAVKFAQSNRIGPGDLAERITELSEGVVIGPMGFKHPDHNFLSRLGAARYFYREYPYYWNRGESFDKRLYEYNVCRFVGRYDMDLETATFKWNTVSSIYKDVMGTFNPRFMRPYFRNVLSEEILEATDGSTTTDVKHCIVEDRDFIVERQSTHRHL